jgi:hypothetical protein
LIKLFFAVLECFDGILNSRTSSSRDHLLHFSVMILSGCTGGSILALTFKMPSLSSKPDDHTECSEPHNSFDSAVTRTKAVRGMTDIGGSAITIYLQSLFGASMAEALKEIFFKTVGDLAAAIDTDADNLKLVGSRLQGVYDCRAALAKKTRADLRRGKIARADAVAQVALLKTLTPEAAKDARSVLGDAKARAESYSLAARTAKINATTRKQRNEAAEAERALQRNQAVCQASNTGVAQIEKASSGDEFELAMHGLFGPALVIPAERAPVARGHDHAAIPLHHRDVHRAPPRLRRPRR